MLLDSNLFIYALLPEYSSLRTWCLQQKIASSDITRLEVLGYHRLSQADRNDLIALFQSVTMYPVSGIIIEQAIRLRQHRKMSLGDAIIAATALNHQQILATHNSKDFNWIEGLSVIDPLDKI